MPEASQLTPDSLLTTVPGLSPAAVRVLTKEGINTVGDALLSFPFRHEDRRRMDFKGFSPSLTPVCHHVRIVNTRVLRFGGRGGVFEAVVEGATDNPMHQQLTLRWFSMIFMQKVLAVDMELIVYGKIKESKTRLLMDHPDYEIVKGEDDEGANIHTGRIVPVYRLRGGLKQKPLRTAVWRVLQNFDDTGLPDLLPSPKADGEFAGMSRIKALRVLHQPEEMADLEKAKRYLALEEFYLMQLRIVRRRLAFRGTAGSSKVSDGALAARFIAGLPFEFTDAQRRCLTEIQRDISDSHPMNRLLHGDVGSGKTVVALAAMLQVVGAGQQAALMAPTQILAEQHYLNAKRWLEPLGVRVALRTGERDEETGEVPLLEGLGSARFQRAASGILPDASAEANKCSRYARRRLPHFERPWAKYFITFTTFERRQLSKEARDITLRALLFFNHVRYRLFAAVVMPDHVHILIEPLPASHEEDGSAVFHELGKILHSIKSFTANEINKAAGRDGFVWEKESHDRMIRSEGDLQEKFTYIVRNPVEDKIVGEGEEYEWLWTPEDPPQDAEDGTLEARVPRTGYSKGPDVFIGTHALLYDAATIPDLGLVVIDEQHKFGVAQRARLIARGTTPDVLVMTATPIPRTLTLTLYGDLDVSTIDQRPKERGRIITAIRTEKKLKEVTKFMLEQIAEGRQCYIVYPLIDESDKLDAGAVTAGLTEWTTKLAPHGVEMLHGRMDGATKDGIMRRFRAGEIKALVSTTVIEVGVDVPNATVMLIHNVERFGLAQLHQLRGRIGRGTHSSYCVLLINEKDEDARERLKIMEETDDGFLIAEEDLKRRGPGDVLGAAQSGQAPLRFGDMLGDTRLVTLARRLAERTLDEDPGLAKPSHVRLRSLVGEEEIVTVALQ